MVAVKYGTFSSGNVSPTKCLRTSFWPADGAPSCSPASIHSSIKHAFPGEAEAKANRVLSPVLSPAKLTPDVIDPFGVAVPA